MAANLANVLAAAETGLLKGIYVQRGQWQNLNSVEVVSKENEINQLCWANKEQSKACYISRKGVVQEIDLSTSKTAVLAELEEDGPYRGLAKHESSFITCNKSGILKVWEPGKKPQLELSVGPDIFKMRHNSQNPHLVATGGKENELKVYDITQGGEPVFTAKNVRNNWLELRVPVWVTDMAFIPDSDKLVTGTGHHQVRVYDPKKQRRPVLDFEFDEYPITCLSLRPNFYEIIVGNTIGTMALLDIRKGAMVHKFKGFAGTVSDIQCHPREPVVVSSSQDRFVRIHDINSQQLLNKFYVKSRLTCLLVSDKWDEQSTEQDNHSPEEEEEVADDIIQSDSDDDVWESMNVIETKKLKRKPKHYHIEEDSDEEQEAKRKKTGKNKSKKTKDVKKTVQMKAAINRKNKAKSKGTGVM